MRRLTLFSTMKTFTSLNRRLANVVNGIENSQQGNPDSACRPGSRSRTNQCCSANFRPYRRPKCASPARMAHGGNTMSNHSRKTRSCRSMNFVSTGIGNSRANRSGLGLLRKYRMTCNNPSNSRADSMNNWRFERIQSTSFGNSFRRQAKPPVTQAPFRSGTGRADPWNGPVSGTTGTTRLASHIRCVHSVRRPERRPSVRTAVSQQLMPPFTSQGSGTRYFD